jgi:hypothetical protein
VISKKNSVSDLVSRALDNNEIDEREFKLIMYEVSKYEKLKSDIRRSRRSTDDDAARKKPQKEVDMGKLREQMREEVIELIGAAGAASRKK